MASHEDESDGVKNASSLSLEAATLFAEMMSSGETDAVNESSSVVVDISSNPLAPDTTAISELGASDSEMRPLSLGPVLVQLGRKV